MGCQGGRGSLSCALCALLLGALAWAAPAAASTITVDDAQVVEGGVATFTITRHADLLAGPVSVSFQTLDGSAGSASDYVAASGTRSFAPGGLGGVQTQQVAVSISSDALNEANETFRLVVGGPEVVDGDATGTIVDDDAVPSLSVSDSPAVPEGAPGAKATFAVHLSAPSGRAVSIAFATANGTATAGQDYAPRSGTLVLNAGRTEASVEVPVLDDSADEPAESFVLALSSPVAATLAGATATATIADDDEPPAPPSTPAPKPQTGPTGSGSTLPGPSSPAGPGSTPVTTGSSSARTSLGLSAPRLKRPSTALVTISCPQSAGRCSGRVTLFSIPNKRSSVKALRKERKLGRVTFALQGGRSQTLALALSRADVGLLRRTGRMRVRAYAITEDATGRTGVRTVSGTLIARTAHSSPSS